MVTIEEIHTIICIITDITVTEEDTREIIKEHLITIEEECKTITEIQAKIRLVNLCERKNMQNNHEMRLKWTNTTQLRMILLDS